MLVQGYLYDLVRILRLLKSHQNESFEFLSLQKTEIPNPVSRHMPRSLRQIFVEKRRMAFHMP